MTLRGLVLALRYIDVYLYLSQKSITVSKNVESAVIECKLS